jgi:hypothetical protein
MREVINFIINFSNLTSFARHDLSVNIYMIRYLVKAQNSARRIGTSIKNYLDRKAEALYYTKTVGKSGPKMKKPVVLAFSFLFSVSVLLTGAFGYSDCAAKCGHEMAKASQHAARELPGLAAPNCCAGATKNTCEMAGAFEIKIPECSMTCRRTVAPDSIGIGLLSRDTESDLFQPNPSDRRSFTGKINFNIPLYLKKLALLC